MTVDTSRRAGASVGATSGRAGSSGQTDGQSRIPHRKLILATIAAVLVAAIGVWVIAFSPVFGVRTVAVRGVHDLSAGQVRSVAHIAGGTPLVRLDTAAVRARVQAMPDVASATVTTSFPSTVTITVDERVPLGVVAAAGGGFMLVDKTGDQFRRVDRRPSHLPVFVVPKGTDARTTGGAVATVAAALPTDVLARIASIQALDPSAITVVMRSGRIVRWGGPESSLEKARVLVVLLRQPGSQLDLTDPDQPFIRP